jgi:hypothetical protein
MPAGQMPLMQFNLYLLKKLMMNCSLIVGQQDKIFFEKNNCWQ